MRTVWKWWLVVAATTFALLETVALLRKRETLSQSIRHWIDVETKPWPFWAWAAVITGAAVWLPVHFLTSWL